MLFSKGSHTNSLAPSYNTEAADREGVVQSGIKLTDFRARTRGIGIGGNVLW